MPTTSTLATRVDGATPGPESVGPLGAARAFGVMLGGPLALVSAVGAASIHSLKALRRGRLPHPGAVAVLGAAAAYRRSIRPWMRTWGATDAELEMELPGDEAVPSPGFEQTHVVAIDAPASEVWPRVAQIGQGRGGFYSYAWLENLAGCRMRSADRVHPEWQRRDVGDVVLLHPATGLKVIAVEPGRSLALEGGWTLAALDDGPGRSRLVARFRAPGGLAGKAYAMLLELPHFIMERRMLLEIKRLVERNR